MATRFKYKTLLAAGRNAVLSMSFAATLATTTPASADVVTDWNAKTVGFVNTAARPAPAWILDLAMVHIAMHDAIQAYQQRFETYAEPVVGATGSPVAAAATAARDMLVSRFPAQSATIQAEYLAYLAGEGLLVSDPGVAAGQEAALRVSALRSNDGAFPLNPEVFFGNTEPGQWRPTQPTFQQPMSAPWMGGVTPFALRDVEGLLHEPGPPHLSSGLYARDYNEVKVLGARFGSARTAAQTSLATFYSGNFFAQMNGVARSVALARLSDIGDTARLLALANVSAADALIVAWDTKRAYNVWRPSTAIFEGDNDGNPRTAGDPTWLPLFNDPPYPDYTSGANSITAAFMHTLALFFDDDVYTFTVTTTVPGQGTRTYGSFSAVADDVVDARIYMGIHFRFADEGARRAGKQAANWAFSHALRPIE
ncbi:MAG: vanadium-dependent haloperoxidase [Phycisphaerales bacterium]